MGEPETSPHWTEIVDLKDALPLATLGERFGFAPGAISAAFERAGVLSGDDALPPEPGESGRRPPRVRPGSKDGQIAAHADLLGEVPDAEIAKKARVSVRTVASYRARHGIAGYRGPRRRTATSSGRTSRVEPHLELLGTVPDREVATKAGVSVHAVRAYRTKRGIPALGQPTLGMETPEPSRAGGATPGRQAWQVAWRPADAGDAAAPDRQGVVVAASMAEAITTASRVVDGEVVGVSLVGPVVG